MDQLRGVLNQVGGDAKEMQAAMSSAFRQIVVGFVDVGKALGQFVTGAFVDASEALANFIGNSIPGIKTIRKELQLMSDDSNAVVASIGKFGTALINVVNNAAIGSIMAITVAITSAAVALYQLGKEQTDIAQANAQFGGAFGASTKEVIAFNSQLSALNVTSSQASQIFIDIAKSGNIGKESFVVITKAAADFEKYVGGKAVDAVKVFSETVKDPVKGLTEFGIQTGFVSKEQVTLVKTLLESGKAAEAQQVAIDALKEGYKKMADESKNSMSNLDLTIIELKSSMSKLWDEFKNSQLVNDLSNVFRLLMGWASGVSFTISALLINIRAIPAAAAAVVHDLANVVSIAQGKTKSMLSQVGNDVSKELDSTAQSHADFIKRMLENNKEFDASSKQSNSEQIAGAKALSELRDRIEKAEGKAVSRQEYINKGLEDARKARANAIKDSEQSAEALKLEARYAEALGKQWDKAHKQKKDPAESFFASSIKTFAADTAKAIGIQEQYTKAQVDFLKIASDPRWLKLTEDERAAIAVKAEAAAQEEVLAKAFKEAAKAEEEQFKILHSLNAELEKFEGTSDRSSLIQRNIVKAFVEGKIEFEDYIRLLKDYQQIVDKVNEDKAEKTSRDLSQSAADRLALIKEESEDLKLQKSIYGFFTVDQKRILEQAKVTRDLRKEILGIEKLTTLEIDKGGITAVQAEKHKVEAYEAAAEKRKNIEQAAALEMYKYYSDALADVISTSLYEGGKAGSKKLRDLIIAELKKPITVVINAISNMIVGSVMGNAGSSLAGSAVSGAAGSMLGGSSLAGLGTSVLEGFGAASSGVGAGVLASSGSMAFQIGQALAAVPVWGWIAGGLAMIASSLDDSGTYHTGGGASYNAATGAVESSVGFQLNPRDVSLSAVDFAKQFTTAIGQMLDATALAFGKTAGYEIATAFADDVSSDGAWGSLVIKKGTETILDWSKTQTSRWAPKEFADGEEGKKQYLAAVAKDVRDTLIKETPSWADAMLNALGEAPTIDGLTQTVTLINHTQSAFEAMALASSSFTNVSDELVNSLIKATGGAANLVSGLNYYYQNFFSEEERKLVMQQQVNAEFAKFNKEVPATREGFKTLVEAAMAAGDAELVSNLLKVAPAFASITDTAEETTDALSEMLKSLKSEAKNLERDLIVASGGNVRAFDTSGMSAAEITQYDYNQSLRDQINAVKAATEASNAATEAAERRAEAVAQEKLGLEKELMQAVGDTASIRALELNALDATNRAIQEHIWAIEDTKAAYEKATDAANTAYSNLEKSIDAEKTKLSTSYEIQKAALQSQLEIQKTAYQSQIDAAQASADKIRDIANALASAVKSVVLSTPALNLGKFKSAMQVVNSGNIYNPELENALDVVSGENQQFYSDFNSYAFDQAVMAANINSMNTAAQMQLSEAERTIQAIEQSMQVAQELVDKQLVELEKKHQEDLAKLQEQLDTGKAQLDALLGIDNSVLSVADAIAALGSAISAAYAAQSAQIAAATVAQSTISAGTFVSSDDAAYRALIDAQGKALNDAKGSAAFWESIGVDGEKGAALAASDRAAVAAGRYDHVGAADVLGLDGKAVNDAIYKYAVASNPLLFDSSAGAALSNAGSGYVPPGLRDELLKTLGISGFDVGINRVPYDMPAMIHKDEAVVPARFNPFNPNASSVNSDLTEAVNSLGARLEAIEANTRFAAIHANKTVKILQGVTQDGTSISTVAA